MCVLRHDARRIIPLVTGAKQSNFAFLRRSARLGVLQGHREYAFCALGEAGKFGRFVVIGSVGRGYSECSAAGRPGFKGERGVGDGSECRAGDQLCV